MRIHFLTYGLSLILLLSACNRAPKFEIPEDLKEYFYYEKGSFWVYEFSGTGDLDTQIVLVSELAWNDNPDAFCDKCKVSYFYESAQMDVSRSFDEDTVTFDFAGQPNNAYPPVTRNGLEVFIEPEEDNENGAGLTITNILDSLVIDSTIYFNVVVVEDSFDVSFAGVPLLTNSYYVKNIGLIRKEVSTSGETWDLVERSLSQD